jgi:hypothetical protein
MASRINFEELSVINYLVIDDLQGRLVPLFPYYDGRDWEQWMSTSDGRLQKIAMVNIYEGKYFSKDPCSVSDQYFYFIDFMVKHSYWPDVAPFVEGIYDDLQNMGACLDKIDLFFNAWKLSKRDVRRFIITEIEYLFSVCRSLYDLLQETIVKMWRYVKFNDPNIKNRQLPSSFADMIIFGNLFLSQGEIQKKRSIPEAMARYYFGQGEFFLWLREFRNYISHSGKSIDFVIANDQGFTISTNTKPFSSMNIWQASNSLPNDLGSVKSLSAFLIHNTLTALDEFAKVMEQTFIFPTDISPQNKIFIRGQHITQLKNLEKRIYKDAWYA